MALTGASRFPGLTCRPFLQDSGCKWPSVVTHSLGVSC